VDDLARRPRPAALIAIGLAGGVLSGAFGVGGGIVLVPLLVNFASLDQRRASATSLLAILPTSVTGSMTYLAHGQVDLLAGGVIAAGSIAGSILGSALLKRIPLGWLRWLFVLVLVVVAVRLAFVEPTRGEPLQFTLPVAFTYLAIGLVLGVSSGLFGIGGGAIAVPALVTLLGVSDLIAKGTSLLVMIPTSLTATIANSRSALVDVRTGLVVGVAAAAASVLGAFIALAMPPRPSAIVFSALLLAIAVQLAIRAWRARG
jgi:uncharacterized membrane protein YfcA